MESIKFGARLFSEKTCDMTSPDGTLHVFYETTTMRLVPTELPIDSLDQFN
jgi:hypothetical protein